jgi:Nucleotidyl transferase AbiEii toxin, Type IV TA system
VLYPFESFNGVAVADQRDIACMKISAIASRGTKRDFIDLYAVAKNYGLPQLLDLFNTKFAQAQYSIVHALKSLVYFEDATKEPMPDMLVRITWEEIEQFFLAEVPGLL